MRKINSLVILTIFIMAFTLVPASVSASEKLPSITIGWTPPDTGIVWSTATNWFEKTAKSAREAGIDVKVVAQTPSSHEAYWEQIGIIEDYLTRNVDVIAISPTEVEVLKPVLKKANKAGVPVIVLNMLEGFEESEVEVASYIGFDNAKTAEAAGEIALNYLQKNKSNQKKYIGLIAGIPGGFFSRTRLEAFKGIVRQDSSVEIVANCPGKWTWRGGVSCGEDILTSHPKKLDLIYGASDNMALGAAKAAKDAGRADEVAFVTQNGTWDSIKAVKEGKLVGDIWHGFPEWGHYGVKFGVMLALGLNEEVPKRHDVGAKKITSDTVDSFYDFENDKPDPPFKPIDWERIKELYRQKQ